MKEKILLVGGGGHCKACIDVIEQAGKLLIAGIVDLPEKFNQAVLGYPVIGGDEDLPNLLKLYKNVLITLGQIKSSTRRMKLFNDLQLMGAVFPVIQSPLSYVSPHAQIADGTIIMHHALINAGARIGKNCIINTKALVEHDAIIEDHCHISTSAVVNGATTVHEGSFLGSNSMCREYVQIGSHSIVSAGAVVTKHVDDYDKVAGIPAKPLTTKNQKTGTFKGGN